MREAVVDSTGLGYVNGKAGADVESWDVGNGGGGKVTSSLGTVPSHDLTPVYHKDTCVHSEAAEGV